MSTRDPSGGGVTYETNEDQALRLLGLKGSGADRATTAANEYMNRNKKEPEMVPVPNDITENDVAQAPEPVLKVAAQTDTIPKQYIEGSQLEAQGQAQIIEGQQKKIEGEKVASQVVNNIPQQAIPQENLPAALIEDKTIGQKETESILKEVDARRAKIQQDLASQKIEPKNFFSGKNTWQKIVGGIGLALSSLTPQTAQAAMQIMSNDIDRDIEAQKAKIANKKEALNDSDKQLIQLRGILKDEKSATAQMRRDRFEAAKFHLQQQVANTNSEVARQKLGLLIKQIEQEDEKIAIQQYKATEGVANKPPSDTQFKTAGYAKSMDQTEKMIQSLSKNEGQTGAGFMDALAVVSPDLLKGSSRKKYESARSAWSMNLLRYESGANLPKQEIADVYKTYFPVVGDSVEVIKSKALLRKQKTESMKAAAGKAYTQIEQAGTPQVAGFKPK